jgi:hypothetical protein
MENEVVGRKIKWWNEVSGRSRRKRTKGFQSRLFEIRKTNIYVAQSSSKNVKIN